MNINKELQDKVESDSSVIDSIVVDIVDKQTKELDDYINKIRHVLERDADNLTLEDLNRIMIRLCTYSYFLISKQELIGVRQDISEAIRAERYNDAYINLSVGTVAKKTATANEAVKEEAVIALIYNRAYKILKGKFDSTVRMVDAVKKIISARIQVMQLTQVADV